MYFVIQTNFNHFKSVTVLPENHLGYICRMHFNLVHDIFKDICASADCTIENEFLFEVIEKNFVFSVKDLKRDGLPIHMVKLLMIISCLMALPVTYRRHQQALWPPSSRPWPYAPLSWSSVACRPCMKWKQLARLQEDRGGQCDQKATEHVYMFS